MFPPPEPTERGMRLSVVCVCARARSLARLSARVIACSLFGSGSGSNRRGHLQMWGFPHHRPVAARYPTRCVGYFYSASSPGGLGRCDGCACLRGRRKAANGASAKAQGGSDPRRLCVRGGCIQGGCFLTQLSRGGCPRPIEPIEPPAASPPSSSLAASSESAAASSCTVEQG